jgi:hypothetical protein
MMLRDEVAYEYRKWNPSASIGRALEFADLILSLIDAQRCVWTWNDDDKCWEGECERVINYCVFSDEKPDLVAMPFCPCCGKRIEVKEGEDART